MTLTELSKKTGINRTALSELLNGKRTVGTKTAKKIAIYLQHPDDWRHYLEIPGPVLRQLLCR
jgi:Helix-turn-helix.